MTQYYQIREDGFKEIKKQMLIRSVPFTVIVLTFVITINTFNSKDKEGLVNILPIMIPLLLVALAVGLYRGVTSQRILFESYQLSISNNLITRNQLNTPTISIYFNDIKEIIKNKNGSFTIKGKDPADLIGVPAQIDNYAALELALNEVKVIARPTSNLLQDYPMVLVFFAMALMLCVYTVTNKIIVAISGTLLLAILGWSFYEMGRSKSIDAKTKRSRWWALIVGVSILSAIIMKLFAVPKP